MNAQRRGTSLKIDIRLALQYLKEDFHQDLSKLSIAELEQFKKELYARIQEIRNGNKAASS